MNEVEAKIWLLDLIEAHNEVARIIDGALWAIQQSEGYSPEQLRLLEYVIADEYRAAFEKALKEVGDEL